MSDTKIEWTDVTWNPIRGCSVISPGCVNCYAMKQAHRFSGVGRPYAGLTKQTSAGPQWTGEVMVAMGHLLDPLRRRKAARVFVNSMSDLFHPSVPDDVVDKIFAVMAMAHWHTFQVLTKRADRMQAYLTSEATRERINLEITLLLEGYGPDDDQPRSLQVDPAARRTDDARATAPDVEDDEYWPLPNVWLGVSVENQKYADSRIPCLLDTPASVRFLSCEPLLEGLDIAKHRPGARNLSWVIVGGESGPGARPCQIWWIRNIVGQCRDADVPVFVKQLGAVVYAADFESFPKPVALSTRDLRVFLNDRKGGDMAEWPEDLCVRQFPEARA